MLRRKLWRTAKVYKVQFISMILLIALGIGVFVGFNAEWVTIGKDTETFFKDCGFADYRIIDEDEGISKELRESADFFPSMPMSRTRMISWLLR